MKLFDDGHFVTLDVHGETVTAALQVITRLIRKGVDKGRGSVKIIHGSSTTGEYPARTTIKTSLHQALDHGDLGSAVIGIVKLDDYTLISLPVSAHRDPSPIRLRDLI